MLLLVLRTHHQAWQAWAGSPIAAAAVARTKCARRARLLDLVRDSDLLWQHFLQASGPIAGLSVGLMLIFPRLLTTIMLFVSSRFRDQGSPSQSRANFRKP